MAESPRVEDSLSKSIPTWLGQAVGRLGGRVVAFAGAGFGIFASSALCGRISWTPVSVAGAPAVCPSAAAALQANERYEVIYIDTVDVVLVHGIVIGTCTVFEFLFFFCCGRCRSHL